MIHFEISFFQENCFATQVKTSMECRYVSTFFHYICIVITVALFFRGCSKYWKDESSMLIEYRTFQNAKRDIYPTITLCMWHTVFDDEGGLYDVKRLNDTYEIKDPLEYTKFLEGKVWEEKMGRVRYDDVTTDLNDRVESIEVAGLEQPILYRWVRSDKNQNGTLKSSDPSSMSTQNFPFYISYRHAYVKCYSLDLSVERMPNIRQQVINYILIKFKEIHIPNINIQYMISYPGQIRQGFTIDLEFKWSQSITKGYLKGKYFLISAIEVFRGRNTLHTSCNKQWKEYDNAVIGDVVKRANCKPSHWNISADYQICNNKEKMREVYIPAPLSAARIASTTFLQKFQRPCDGILAATLNTISERKGISLGGLISSGGGTSAELGFLFKNDRYKEIEYTRAIDFESLISYVGGYIGLFLGFAIWQLPDAIEFLKIKLQDLQGGKIHFIYYIRSIYFEIKSEPYTIRKWHLIICLFFNSIRT